MKQKGFTLIELLVVISIIGLLSAVVLVSMNTARAKARDTKRRADLKQLQLAIETYYDANNAYPNTGLSFRGQCEFFNPGGVYGANDWITGLVPTHMSQLPQDPNYLEPTNCYAYISNGTDYKLIAYNTPEVNCPVPASDPMADPGRPNSCIFAVYTPGGSGY